jgi:hypothetical protein
MNGKYGMRIKITGKKHMMKNNRYYKTKYSEQLLLS